MKFSPKYIPLAVFVFLMLALFIMRGTNSNDDVTNKENSVGSQKQLTTLTSKKRKEKTNKESTTDQDSADPHFDPEMKKLMDQLGVRIPSRDELEKYITKSNNNTEALVAAGIILNDSSYFVRALENNPNDAHALFCLAVNDSTDELMKIDLAKKLLKEQPENAIASFLLASLQAESGNVDESIKTLLGSFDQTEYNDFYHQASLTVEDALRETGSNETGSTLYSLWNAPLPILSKIQKVTKTAMGLVPESNPDKAQELRSLAASIGAKTANEGNSIIHELVGISAQMMSLKGMEDDAISPFENLSVKEARKSLEKRKNSIRNLTIFMPNDFLTMDNALIESYTNRIRIIGEYEASRWLMERTKKKNP